MTISPHLVGTDFEEQAKANNGPIAPPIGLEAELARLAPTPHLRSLMTNNLRRLPPGNLLRHGAQNYFLYFHCSLHRGL